MFGFVCVGFFASPSAARFGDIGRGAFIAIAVVDAATLVLFALGNAGAGSFALGLAVSGGLLYFWNERSWRNRADVRYRLVSELGLRITETPPPTASYLVPALIGHPGECRRTMAGQWQGRDIAAFDWMWTQSTRGAPWESLCACAIIGLHEQWGRVIVKPVALVDRLKGAIGLRRVRTGDGRFDAAFWVTADPADAQRLLDERVREWLLAERPRPRVLVAGLSLVMCGTSPRQDIEAVVRGAAELAQRLPSVP